MHFFSTCRVMSIIKFNKIVFYRFSYKYFLTKIQSAVPLTNCHNYFPATNLKSTDLSAKSLPNSLKSELHIGTWTGVGLIKRELLNKVIRKAATRPQLTRIQRASPVCNCPTATATATAVVAAQ